MKKQQISGRNLAMLAGGIAAGVVGSRLVPPLIATAAGAARTSAGTDPFRPLIADHKKILAVLEEMVAAPANSRLRRSRLFLTLKRTLAKHVMAEEDVVYPLLHGEAGQIDETKRLYDEHADMKILLFRLEQHLASGEDWSEPARSLRDLIREHASEEENTIFPQLRQKLDEDKIRTMSARIHREEALIV